MITDEVIKEIYKKYKRPPKNQKELRLDFYLQKLQGVHSLRLEDNMIVNYDLEEFNPFRRFLIRSLNVILEFDKMIAFVFPNHILFFGKENNDMRVYIKAEKPASLWDRLFSR